MISDAAVEAALDVAIRMPVLGEPLRNMFELDPSIAEAVGVKLETPGKWHWYSDIAIDEQDDTVRAILRPIFRAALEAALPHLTEGWQSMESAPKDGKRILLWWPHWGRWPMVGTFFHGQWVADRALSENGDPGPLAWMPIPTPPIRNGEAT